MRDESHKPPRPKRKYIPIAIRRAAVKRQGGKCACGCGEPVSVERGSGTDFDHDPALILRRINRKGTDYIPPQLSPKHIVARTRACHHRKTRGTGATTAGTDIGMMKKNNRRERKKDRIKCRWPRGRKLQSKPFPKRRMP